MNLEEQEDIWSGWHMNKVLKTLSYTVYGFSDTFPIWKSNLIPTGADSHES